MPQPTSTATSISTVIASSTESLTQHTTEPSTMPTPTVETPSKVVGVRVTPGVQHTSPTLIVTWQAVAGGAVTYTVKYSTQPGEVNTPSEGALEVKGISGTSTVLTALERGTTYYIWVVGVSEGGEGPHSDRMSRVTYDSELNGAHCTPLLNVCVSQSKQVNNTPCIIAMQIMLPNEHVLKQLRLSTGGIVCW